MTAKFKTHARNKVCEEIENNILYQVDYRCYKNKVYKRLLIIKKALELFNLESEKVEDKLDSIKLTYIAESLYNVNDDVIYILTNYPKNEYIEESKILCKGK